MPTHPCRVASTILRHGEYYLRHSHRVSRSVIGGLGSGRAGRGSAKGGRTTSHAFPGVLKGYSRGTPGVLKGCCTSHAFPRTRVSVAAPPVNFSLHGIMQHATCNMQRATRNVRHAPHSIRHAPNARRPIAAGRKRLCVCLRHASAGRAVTGMHLEHTGSDGLCISRMSTC
jgi:hypothetical protein